MTTERLSDLCAPRLAGEQDYNFILANWSKSFRSSPWAGTVRNNHYHSSMKNTIDDLIERGMLLVVLCSLEDSDQLLGFIAYEVSSTVPVVHYLFIKPDFRGHKLTKKLLNHINASECFIYTHRTIDCNKLNNAHHVALLARRKELEPVYKPE